MENIKHSLTYSGGLSRAYVRTYAPAQRYGFDALSPYTVRSAIAPALAIPFETVLNGSVERLYTLKADVVQAGVQAVTGIDMPAYPKRRFQDGVGGETLSQLARQQGLVPSGLPAPVGGAPARSLGPGERAVVRQRSSGVDAGCAA